MRAVEFNKSLIRVSNNGISAAIDRKGKIIDFIQLNNSGIKHLAISNSHFSNLKQYHQFERLLK